MPLRVGGLPCGERRAAGEVVETQSETDFVPGANVQLETEGIALRRRAGLALGELLGGSGALTDDAERLEDVADRCADAQRRAGVFGLDEIGDDRGHRGREGLVQGEGAVDDGGERQEDGEILATGEDALAAEVAGQLRHTVGEGSDGVRDPLVIGRGLRLVDEAPHAVSVGDQQHAVGAGPAVALPQRPEHFAEIGERRDCGGVPLAVARGDVVAFGKQQAAVVGKDPGAAAAAAARRQSDVVTDESFVGASEFATLFRIELLQPAIGGEAAQGREALGSPDDALDAAECVELLAAAEAETGGERLPIPGQHRFAEAVERAFRDASALVGSVSREHRCEVTRVLARGKRLLEVVVGDAVRGAASLASSGDRCPGGIGLDGVGDLALPQVVAQRDTGSLPVQHRGVGKAGQAIARCLLDRTGNGADRLLVDAVDACQQDVGEVAVLLRVFPLHARRERVDELRPLVDHLRGRGAHQFGKDVAARPEVATAPRRGDESLYRAEGNFEEPGIHCFSSTRNRSLPLTTATARKKPLAILFLAAGERPLQISWPFSCIAVAVRLFGPVASTLPLRWLYLICAFSHVSSCSGADITAVGATPGGGVK